MRAISVEFRGAAPYGTRVADHEGGVREKRQTVGNTHHPSLYAIRIRWIMELKSNSLDWPVAKDIVQSAKRNGHHTPSPSSPKLVMGTAASAKRTVISKVPPRASIIWRK